MTFEEAKKILNVELLAITLESNVSKETQKKRLNEKFAALNMAVGAIDKQIPRKPIRLLYHEVGDCPFCETTVYISEDGFCPSCGQALDWSEEI